MLIQHIIAISIELSVGRQVDVNSAHYRTGMKIPLSVAVLRQQLELVRVNIVTTIFGGDIAGNKVMLRFEVGNVYITFHSTNL